jgi:succinoglycan biosynthesis protein ExoA
LSQPGSPTAVLRNVSSLESNVGVEPLQNAAGSCSAADKFVITSNGHELVSLRKQKEKIIHGSFFMRDSSGQINLRQTKMIPAVSVIVPCRNERPTIESCVRSILEQEPPSGGFEVIVADGMSDDGTREVLEGLADKHPHLRVVDNPNCIVSSALNAAISLATGSVIVRMDAHTDYAPDYIRRCYEVLAETGSDNVGGPWIAHGEGYVSRAIAAAFQSPFCTGGARGHDPKYEGIVDTVYLGCWPRDIFDRVGFFDEELVRNQDDEFNLRLTRAGGKIWQSPRIKSWYKPRNSVAALFRQYVQYGYWKVRVIQKHHAPASLRHLVPGSFVFLLVILAPLSFASAMIRWAWLGLIGTYISANLVASLVAAKSKDLTLFPMLTLVFGCFHLAYGYGFVRGIWDFVFLRREGRPRFSVLTRTSADGGRRDGAVLPQRGQRNTL